MAIAGALLLLTGTVAGVVNREVLDAHRFAAHVDALFLLNHRITDKAREVSNASLVNARDVLLPRAEQCRAERGRQPTFVAVDFYDRGDLFGVVDTLNGVR